MSGLSTASTLSTTTAATIDLRGRDLVIMPPESWLHLQLPELLVRLFGPFLPAPVHTSLTQDKRHRYLRTWPIYFRAIKLALRQQKTPFTILFEEQPALPRSLALAIEPRPYQEEALGGWLA